ncbi:MAG: hypothetical protein GWP91_24255 [Rhodobacterales bacterium]|nr:hypothetical protein [Rhodobacterales bacterium]
MKMFASSPHERLSHAEVVERVTLLAPGIIVMREVPAPNVVTVRQLFEQAAILLNDEPMFGLIADLRQAGFPTATVRHQIREEVSALGCSRMSLVMAKNSVFQVAAKFIIVGLRVTDTSLHNSVDEALKDILND